MSKQKRTRDFLFDIEEAIGRILTYSAGMSWETYLLDMKTQDAVVRNLEIIGEATKRLPDEYRAKNSDIPWREIAGTRDRLTHHYFGINQEIVWQIIQDDLPVLKGQIERLILGFTEENE